MYFITSINKQSQLSKFLEDRQLSKRCFGYFTSQKLAMEMVEKNAGNLHECFYDYLVIEQIFEGIHGSAKEICWYKWSEQKNFLDNHKGNAWQRCDKPEFAMGLTNWAIG